MDLQHAITKSISFAAFLGLSLAPQRTPLSVAGAVHTQPSPAPERVETTAAERPATPACGDGMLLVEGEYCPNAEHTCLAWLDPPPYQRLRCAEYAKPAKCKGPRERRRFCIDREEYADPATSGSDDVLPVVNKSWLEARALCEARGARLCKESEWQFACEGPDMIPYPYGWKRDATACNFDRTDLGGAMEKLTDHRAPLASFPACVSPFGVHHMVGNVDEWVEREGISAPNRSALRGGWWLPGRNRCRAATTAHGEEYSGKQVGFRCCADAAPAP